MEGLVRKPDIENVAKAWKMTWQDGRKSSTATLAQYLIEGNFHIHWNQWVVCLISLADIVGVKPAKKHHEDNTHELLMISVNPDTKLDPDEIYDGSWALSPIDLVKQFKVPMDMDAEDIAKLCVQAICDGRMSPDSDFRSAWIATIDATAEHYFGEHETKH